MGNKDDKPKEPKDTRSEEDKMFEAVFDFKMMAKQYTKESEKSAANEKAALKKVRTVCFFI
jgi:hypothetical protein